MTEAGIRAYDESTAAQAAKEALVTSALTSKEKDELNNLLRFIREKHGISVLLIEHDMGVVMEISDHIIVLDYGEKISDGSAEFVRNDPRVIAAYLGVEDEAEVAAVEADVQ